MSARLCALASPCNGFLFYCISSPLLSIATPVLSLLLSCTSSPRLALLVHFSSAHFRRCAPHRQSIPIFASLGFSSAHHRCALLRHSNSSLCPRKANLCNASPPQGKASLFLCPRKASHLLLRSSSPQQRFSLPRFSLPSQGTAYPQPSFANQHNTLTLLNSTLPLPNSSTLCLSFLPHPRPCSPRENCPLKNCASRLCRCICRSPATLQ